MILVHVTSAGKRFSFPGKTRGSCQEAPDNYQQPLLFTSGQRTKPQTGTTGLDLHTNKHTPTVVSMLGLSYILPMEFQERRYTIETVSRNSELPHIKFGQH